MRGESEKKQAVVLIHGVGEQVPMDTLRGFVQTIWTDDDSLRREKVPQKVWSKPDDASKNYELRRLTTAEDRNRRRTDFFEFYWADLMTGTRWSHIVAWARVLLFRSPRRIPGKLLPIWLGLVILGLLIGAGAIAHAFHWDPGPAWLGPTLGVVGSAVWLLFGGFLIATAGDAARYLHVAPSNIKSRRKIRDAGIELLTALHEEGIYDRIIVVGHSLGSVIGYDILTHLWARYYNLHYPAASKESGFALREAELLAASKEPHGDFVTAFQTAARNLHDEQSVAGNPWLVTDFVTLGSPLAHASVLLARDDDELKAKRDEREFPTCPPVLESVEKLDRFSYKSNGAWVLHHAAVFGVTRWTNLYFPVRRILWGDIIGGPLQPSFGRGIRDIPVETKERGGFLAHTLYWSVPQGVGSKDVPPHIARLREAVGICE